MYELDELTRLRDLRSEGIDPTEAEDARGLAALERHIAAGRHTPRRKSSRRFWGSRRARAWGGAGVIAVGAVVGAVAVVAPSAVFGPVATPDPGAEASALLERSAQLLPEITVHDGQYLRFEVSYQQIMTQPWLSDGSDVTYRTREHRVSYAPADDGGIWTFRQQEESPTEIVSALPAGISEADALQQIAQHISLESRESQSIAGRYPVTPEGQAEANAMYPQVQADAQALREAPTDTAELRAFLLARAQNDDFLLPEPRSDDDAVKSQIGDIVGDPMAPHALRAAALRLLGELPGVVAEPYDPAPDSLGNPPFIAAGTAITVNEFRGNSFQLIFDTESARMLGTRVVLTEETEQYPGSEVGTVTLLQRIESTVVDQIPDVESW